MVLGTLGSSVLGAQETESGSDTPTVAVSDFQGVMIGEAGNSAPLGKAVASMLTTELSNRPGLRVIERHQIQDVLTEQRLALSGRVDESSAVEIGKMLGAQYFIYGQVTAVGQQMRMDMRAVDVETSEVLTVEKISDRPSELLAVVVRLADIFMSKLELDAPSARPDVEEIPVQATIVFSRALDAEDQGDVERAMELYEQTLEIYPNHRGAQRALERLRGGGD